jgi:hypothetical protein
MSHVAAFLGEGLLTMWQNVGLALLKLQIKKVEIFI